MTRDANFVRWALSQPGVRAQIDAANGKRITFLSYAITAKKLDTFIVLLESGASTQVQNSFRESFLQQAINGGAPEKIIKSLLQYNVRLDVNPLCKHANIISFAESRSHMRAKALIEAVMKFSEVSLFYFEQLLNCVQHLIRVMYIKLL
jgi:predicted RNA binding protein with dsRBD fold (UPF0201 family)